jgi:hypothetical protein
MSEDVPRLEVSIVGRFDAGKSALFRALKGEPFNAEAAKLVFCNDPADLIQYRDREAVEQRRIALILCWKEQGKKRGKEEKKSLFTRMPKDVFKLILRLATELWLVGSPVLLNINLILGSEQDVFSVKRNYFRYANWSKAFFSPHQ